MAQTTGTSWIRVNSQLKRTKPGTVDFNPGGFERASQAADNKPHVGFTKKPVGCTLSCTLIHMSDTDMAALNAIEDATIELETDSGKVYQITGSSAAPPQLTGEEGEMAVSYIGPPAIDIT